ILIGDFNGDHIPDLLTGNENGQFPSVSVLLGNGDGTFQQPAILTPSPRAVQSIGLGDFNGDGRLDAVMAGQTADSEAMILLGNGDGTFTSGQSYPVGSSPEAIVVGDLNGDHELDLVVTATGEHDVDVLLGHGDGTFAPAV